ncbi:MAG: hypothetical protein IPL51_07470 [Candidatus Competibacteraceae bacterium]|nr:hypothetical protein [Candidatus Competibacteraceae bacterium]
MTNLSKIKNRKRRNLSANLTLLLKILNPITDFLFRTSRKIMPQNRLGDKIVSYINFLMNNNRLPKKQLSLNDVLYSIKTTDEILDPLRVFVSDKEFLKLFVSASLGDQYNVPTLDVIRDIKALDTYAFPPTCCIKPTHASGEVIIRRNNEPLDMERIKSWFKLNYYLVTREANYKLLKPKIIVEPLIFQGERIEDYKFLCYQGQPKLVWVDIDRYTQHKRKVFDCAWNELNFSITKPRSEASFKKPNNFSRMLEVASNLASQFSFVRIDLYSDGNTILVGEITNCSGNAGERFLPAESEPEASKILFDVDSYQPIANAPTRSFNSAAKHARLHQYQL